MIIHNLEQQTPLWFELKWGKIGGTLAKDLFKRSESLFYKILSEKLEQFDFEDDYYINSHMQRGNDLEPFARDFLNSYTGLKFNEVGWIQSECCDLLGISPDGITEDLKNQCEIKCLSRKKHTEILVKQEIPLEYIFQCCHAFAVNNILEKLYFISFRPECNVNNFIKCITLKSIVNVGTEKKTKKMTVEAVRDYLIEFHNELNNRVNKCVESLMF